MSDPPVARWGAPIRRSPRPAPTTTGVALGAPATDQPRIVPGGSTSLAFEDPHADVARLIERRLARPDPTTSAVDPAPEEG